MFEELGRFNSLRSYHIMSQAKVEKVLILKGTL